MTLMIDSHPEKDATRLPKVSVLWLNYNTNHIKSAIEKILTSLVRIDYPNFELIVVDNGSTDGSWELIQNFINYNIFQKIQIKMLKLKNNYGFCGGYNAAYAMRDPDTKYVLLINTDAIPNQNIINEYVHFMESNVNVGALQGIVESFESKKVDSAGFYFNDIVAIRSPFINKNIDQVLKYLNNPVELSYVEGTMPMYRVDAVEKVIFSKNNLYLTAGFMYYLEDMLLSTLLWGSGYKCVLIPKVVGRHLRGAIMKKHRIRYLYSVRNRVAFLVISNSPYRIVIPILWCLKFIFFKPNAKLSHVRALIDGIRLGKALKKQYRIIDFHNVPRFKVTIKGLIRTIFID